MMIIFEFRASEQILLRYKQPYKYLQSKKLLYGFNFGHCIDSLPRPALQPIITAGTPAPAVTEEIK